MTRKLENKIMYDIAEHAKTVMIKHHISFNALDSDRDIILAYSNVCKKFVTVKPRRIVYSKELEEKMNNKSFVKDNIAIAEDEAVPIIDLIRHFENLFVNGVDINNHLSTQIFTSKTQDMLFNTWNIKHIHLNKTEAMSKSAMKRNRADFILFYVIDMDYVYFLDARQHPKGNEFSSYSFLKIAYNNGWMGKLSFMDIGKEYVPYSMKPQITDDESLYKLYNDLHVNVSFDFEGHGFVSFGIVSTGDSGANVLILNQMIKSIRSVLSNESDYLGFKPRSVDACIGNVEFKVGNHIEQYLVDLDNNMTSLK